MGNKTVWYRKHSRVRHNFPTNSGINVYSYVTYIECLHVDKPAGVSQATVMLQVLIALLLLFFCLFLCTRNRKQDDTQHCN